MKHTLAIFVANKKIANFLGEKPHDFCLHRRKEEYRKCAGKTILSPATKSLSLATNIASLR